MRRVRLFKDSQNNHHLLFRDPVTAIYEIILKLSKGPDGGLLSEIRLRGDEGGEEIKIEL